MNREVMKERIATNREKRNQPKNFVVRGFHEEAKEPKARAPAGRWSA